MALIFTLWAMIAQSEATEAPFAGIAGASNDRRGIYFGITDTNATLTVPEHAGTYRAAASLLIACRVPGPPTSIGPDPGYLSAVIVLPDHPEQSPAYSFFHPQSWFMHLFGTEVQTFPVSVRLPSGENIRSVLIRRRVTYGIKRPRLQIKFPPDDLLTWLSRSCPIEKPWVITIEGKGTTVTMRLALSHDQKEAVRRMDRFRPRKLAAASN